MKKILMSMLVVALFAAPTMASNMWYWADETGAALTGPVDVVPGQTLRVWTIATTNMAGWPPLNRVRQEAWWDTAVIDGWSNSVFYNDAANGMVSDLCAGNYGAGEDYGFPDYGHYGNVDLWATIYYYGGMRMVGFDFVVRADAPLGTSIIGGAVLGTDYWSGGVILSERNEIDFATDNALELNVVPEPATMSLLAMGGIAALIRRRK
jgi:hypothetical protein